jgi:hypothetical protein
MSIPLYFGGAKIYNLQLPANFFDDIFKKLFRKQIIRQAVLVALHQLLNEKSL